ncbi:GOLPH3/VPS74 family protein [Streptomyces griseorubiginosus]|uniref:GOLPH3/VPS74 family protein n=1 Tax=Streptomyces griseorubiginosus TaxID=67304 RepID=UPI002E81C17B|nr:GPP34 family phosphoprotein [Streptomyces griseorubiginosus]WUB43043.1 GPP34 family phosphoprotein [Streptomyces griseorubiginosus]WUB51561.1 GPP34 family phosphoprotein [Streptomyces griseorubiginosus]
MTDGSLSLPARLYLLAWDTSKSEVTGAAQVPQLVRAGALAELAQRGLLLDEDGIATPVDMDASTGDPVLDGLLELVRESRPHRWRAWVTLHARVTLDAVREQLTAGGYLRARKKRALGLFPTVDHELARPAVAEALQEEARRILRGPTADLPDRDAALGALAAAAELRTLLPRKDRHDTHTEQLIEHSGPASPVLRKIVHEVRGAATAARVATRA